MQKLNMVDADTLLYQPLDKPRFVVDGLIPTGLILFCGSQKIGKSWLMLKLCFWQRQRCARKSSCRRLTRAAQICGNYLFPCL